MQRALLTYASRVCFMYFCFLCLQICNILHVLFICQFVKTVHSYIALNLVPLTTTLFAISSFVVILTVGNSIFCTALMASPIDHVSASMDLFTCSIINVDLNSCVFVFPTRPSSERAVVVWVCSVWQKQICYRNVHNSLGSVYLLCLDQQQKDRNSCQRSNCACAHHYSVSTPISHINIGSFFLSCFIHYRNEWNSHSHR